MILKAAIAWQEIERWADGLADSPFPSEWHEAVVPHLGKGIIINSTEISLHETIRTESDKSSVAGLIEQLSLHLRGSNFRPCGAYLRSAPNGLVEYRIEAAWFEEGSAYLGLQFGIRTELTLQARPGSIEANSCDTHVAPDQFPVWPDSAKPFPNGEFSTADWGWWDGDLDTAWRERELVKPEVRRLWEIMGRNCLILEPTGSGLDNLHDSCQPCSEGPIPMPTNMPWPDCPNCEVPFHVNASYSFSGLPFEILLPGQTLMTFFCPDCVVYGNGDEGGMLFHWLRKEDVLVLRIRPGCSTNHPAEKLLARAHREFPSSDDVVHRLLPFASTFDALKDEGPEWPIASKNRKAGGYAHWLQNPEIPLDSAGYPMEFISTHFAPEEVPFYGFIFVFHSVITGETKPVFCDT
jgi:hypothetical protein